MLPLLVFSIICLVSRISHSAPIQVARLADVAPNLKTCGPSCTFMFSASSTEVSKNDSLVVTNGQSVTLTGAAGGTVLRCKGESSVVIQAVGITGGLLTLEHLTIRNCSNVQSFINITGMSLLLKNVTFVGNHPKAALVFAQVLPQQSIQLNSVNFSMNTLQHGAHLLQVVNQNVTSNWSIQNQELVKAVWGAACEADVLESITFPKTENRLLRPEVVDTLTGNAFNKWTAAETLLQSSLPTFLVKMQVEGLYLRGNRAVDSKGLTASPQLPAGTNLPSDAVIGAAQAGWAVSGQYDFLQLTGVQLVARSLLFELNTLDVLDAPSQACHTLLHLAAGAAVISNMTVVHNRLVSALHVSDAVGATQLSMPEYRNNTIQTCSLLRFEGRGVLPPADSTDKDACWTSAPTIPQLRKGFALWEGMFFIPNEWGEYTGMVKPVGMTKLKDARVFRDDDDLAQIRDDMGLSDTFENKTYYELSSNSFASHLEYAVFQKSLQSKRNSPLIMEDASFVSNSAVNTSLFHVTTSSQNVTRDGTLLQLNNITFRDNNLSSASSHPQALLHLEASFGKLEGINVVNNSAGAIVMELTTANLTNVMIRNNTAPGAVWVVGNATEREVVNLPQLHLVNVQVVNNSAAGPIAVLQDVNVQLESVKFMNNTGEKDSQGWQASVVPAYNTSEGVVFAQKVKWLKFEDVVTESNTGNTTIMLFYYTLWREILNLRCNYNQGTCLMVTECWTRDLNLDGDANSIQDFYQIRDSWFVNNKGSSSDQAAGLQITNLEWQQFEIYGCTFADNLAVSSDGLTYGGGLGSTRDIVHWRTKQASYVYLHHCNFYRNRADIGGAAHFEESQFSLHDCNFINNSATQMAGAVYVNTSQWDYMFYSTFEGNTAPQGGALVALIEPYHWHLPSNLQEVHIIANTFRRNSATGTRNDLYHETWEVCPGGGGGALCFTASYANKKLLNFAFQGNVFDENSATYGGALLINNKMPVDTAPRCYFNLVNNTITNNVAINGSAPVLFYNNSANLCLSCDSLPELPPLRFHNSETLLNYTKPKYATSSIMPLPADGCADPGILWSNNRAVGKETYSEKALATFVQSVDLHFCKQGGADCEEKTRVGRSGDVVTAKVRLEDAYGNAVPRSPINITIVIREAGGEDTGLLVYNWKPVLLNQSNTVLRNIAFQTLQEPDNTTYPLVFVPVTTQGTIQPITLNLTVRKCNLGEVLGTLYTCTLCDKGSFSLKPNIGCLPCAAKASCIAEVNESYAIGQGLLVPQPGYWKSSPYSPLPNRCPLVGSCGSTSRDAGEERTQMLLTLLSNKSYPLDNATYDKFMQLQCSNGYSGRLCGQCDEGHGRMGDRCIICLAKPRWNGVLMLLALLFICLFVAMLTYNHAKNIFQRVRQAGLEVNHNAFMPNHGDTMTSVIKVIISYIQVLTILRSIQIDWPSHLLRFFSNVDVTSAVGWVSLDCSIPGRSPQTKAIARSMVAMFLPVVLTVFATVFWWCWGRTSRRALMQSWVKWYDFLALTIIQICFTLYTFSTGATMSLFACTEVDHMEEGSMGLKQYTAPDPEPVVREQSFWSQNYEQKCREGNHAVVAYGLGLPWLMLFSFGFPIWSAAKLAWRRQHLATYHYMLKYGFLYQEYQSKYYAWESVIMLRKVGLLAVVIFMRESGSVVQLTTASLLLYIFILLHELVRPYRTQLVNGIERASLFASMANIACLTFLAASPNRTLRVSMTVIIFIVNVLVLAYFLCILYLVGSQWIRQNGGKLQHAAQQVSEGLKRYRESIALGLFRKNAGGKRPMDSIEGVQLHPHTGKGAQYQLSCDLSPTTSPHNPGRAQSSDDALDVPAVRVPSPARRDQGRVPFSAVHSPYEAPAGHNLFQPPSSSRHYPYMPPPTSASNHHSVPSPTTPALFRMGSLADPDQFRVPSPAIHEAPRGQRVYFNDEESETNSLTNTSFRDL